MPTYIEVITDSSRESAPPMPHLKFSYHCIPTLRIPKKIQSSAAKPQPAMNTAQAQQFAALQKATSNFNNDGRMADHARRREADMVVRASEQDRRDTEELRKAHGEFGEETRKRKNLEVERRRCKQASEADREAIIKITSELNGIEVRVLYAWCSCSSILSYIPLLARFRPSPPPPQ